MQAIKDNGKCKSCGCIVDPGEIRCQPHLRQYLRWLAQQTSDRGSSIAYSPRFNGIAGVERDEDHTRRQRIAFSLVPGLRPEQPLKFD